MSALAGAVTAAGEGTPATGIAEGQSWWPQLEQPEGHSGVCRACPFCLQLLPVLPRGTAFADSWGLSATAAVSFGSSWARWAHANVANSQFLPILCHSHLPHSHLGCKAQHLPMRPAPTGPPCCPSTPLSPPAGARQGAEVLLEAARLQVFQTASEPFP